MRPFHLRFAIGPLACAFVALLSLPEAGFAALTSSQVDQVTLRPRTGDGLPLSLRLTDEFDATKPLKEWLGNVPTVWIAADYTCKSLCGPMISIVSSALADTGLQAGSAYRLMVFGLDPRDTAADARAMKAAQVNPRANLVKQSVFLRAVPSDVSVLLAALGIGAAYDVEHDQFAHPVAAFVVTPEGRLSQVVSGIAIDPGNLRLALVDAGRGRIGTWSDQIHLLCYGFDPATGLYTLAVWRILAGASVITMVALIVLMALLIRRDASRPS
ncbi:MULTISPECIES: SCO family protein [Bradyrhizobium]|uniref:SCO family protein n=1 Tax=Bradyrhizobium elkanii TaxID=29448 RepID=A0A4V6CVR6_BRAEL|nr:MULTISPECIES: SCO family protein [Bradyrhizobium]MTV11993.1 SCO family protein [Bradyrhizobium sp. BR2003]TKV74115.1 SCO family protein [Bradyrhizobium elkanii]